MIIIRDALDSVQNGHFRIRTHLISYRLHYRYSCIIIATNVLCADMSYIHRRNLSVIDVIYDTQLCIMCIVPYIMIYNVLWLPCNLFLTSTYSWYWNTHWRDRARVHGEWLLFIVLIIYIYSRIEYGRNPPKYN